MRFSNHERVGRALELLRAGLRPFVEREMRAAYGDGWTAKIAADPRSKPLHRDRSSEVKLDVHALLATMANNWRGIFGDKLGKMERSFIEELRETRNLWAHQEPLADADADRANDTVARLLRAVGAAAEA